MIPARGTQTKLKCNPDLHVNSIEIDAAELWYPGLGSLTPKQNPDLQAAHDVYHGGIDEPSISINDSVTWWDEARGCWA